MVLVAFNRSALTARTLAAIRHAAPEQLFLVADGPRADHPGDVADCAAVRDVLAGVDWPCNVRRRYAAVNEGIEATVEAGLDWVFSHVDRAIVLEDDCVPHPTFFDYCARLLDRYADDDRVWQVAGHSHGLDPGAFAGRSYAFTAFGSVWGWATWRRAWLAHRARFPREHADGAVGVRVAAPVRPAPLVLPTDRLVTVASRRHFERVARAAESDTDGDEHGWDYHWWLSMLATGGLAATPAVNLVSNVGFGEGATHTRSTRQPIPAVPARFPLRHPPAVALDERVERELELAVVLMNGDLARLVRRFVRSVWLRGVLRAVAESRPVRRLLRSRS